MSDWTGLAIASSIALALTGCVTPTQYWVRPNTNNQQTAKDLYDCRQAARSTSTQQVFTAMELEAPCMGAKGYALSTKPAPA